MNRHDYDCRDHIHRRTGQGDQCALPARLGKEFVGRAGAFFGNIVARHADISAKRQNADAVIGGAALHAEQARAEAN